VLDTLKAAAEQVALQTMREIQDGRRWAVRGGWWTAFLETNGLAGGQVERYGATEYEARAIRFGILDLPSIPFTSGVVLPVIPHSREDLEFRRCDLGAGCASGIYEEVGLEEVREAVCLGRMVSSAFLVWQREGAERKGRFVINFSRQSRH
jgi:hypothetical protein